MIGFVISLLAIAVVVYLLVKKYPPQGVLFAVGFLLYLSAALLGHNIPILEKLQDRQATTGLFVFDLFAIIRDIFSTQSARVGLIIMSIAGFVGYMKHIGASDVLVSICLRPLQILRKFPYMTASIIIIFGQFLSMCISSAAGLGLLLMATLFPLLIELGISRVSAVSVIVACTAFDMGPASVNTLKSAELLGISAVDYFLNEQFLSAMSATIVLAIAIFFTNRFYDKKEKLNEKPTLTLADLKLGQEVHHSAYGNGVYQGLSRAADKESAGMLIEYNNHEFLLLDQRKNLPLLTTIDAGKTTTKIGNKNRQKKSQANKIMLASLSKETLEAVFLPDKKFAPSASLQRKVFQVAEKDLPDAYALLPILPLALLIVFSRFFDFFEPPIILDTATAMFLSTVISMLAVAFHRKSLHPVLHSSKVFWQQMGHSFATIVTLIVAASFFAQGLIALGFIESLIALAQNLGFALQGITVVMTMLIFIGSINLGSGNAVFFAFSPMVPGIALNLAAPVSSLILPMQLAASMGRAISPISAVVLATTQLAGISPFQILKRNLLPMLIALAWILSSKLATA